MRVLNDLDRFHLVMDAIDRLPQTGDKGIYLKQLKDKLIEHKQYINQHGLLSIYSFSAPYKIPDSAEPEVHAYFTAANNRQPKEAHRPPRYSIYALRH
jgi:hypothetical protein